jgi:hypothetical protein
MLALGGRMERMHRMNSRMIIPYVNKKSCSQEKY